MTLARYLKAAVPIGAALVSAMGFVWNDWYPDAHVTGSTWRFSLGVFFYGIANGYGVAVTPNAPPKPKGAP